MKVEIRSQCAFGIAVCVASEIINGEKNYREKIALVIWEQVSLGVVRVRGESRRMLWVEMKQWGGLWVEIIAYSLGRERKDEKMKDFW